jgi:hypothetical protein
LKLINLEFKKKIKFCQFFGVFQVINKSEKVKILTLGLVQTGSVFLNAKPENFRCKNEFDNFENTSYSSSNFGSPSNPCKQYNLNFGHKCLNEKSNAASCFENLKNSSIPECSSCVNGFVFSPENIFKGKEFTKLRQI